MGRDQFGDSPRRKAEGNQCMKNHFTRRGFIRRAAAGSAVLTWLGSRRAPMVFAGETAKPALLGGVPVHQEGWPDWPKWLESWEPAVVQVLRSGKWYRGDGGHVAEFEAGFPTIIGGEHRPATASRMGVPPASQRSLGADGRRDGHVSP